MSLLTLRALLFAGECFLASLLLPVLAFAATALLRRRAALRHLVWTAMFGVLAVLPVVALLLPPRRIVEHVAAPVADMTPVAAPAVMTATLTAAPSPLTLENGVTLLVALWLMGLAWQFLRLGVGGLGLMRLRRASTPFASEIQTGCAVRLSRGEHGPSTFGIFRPVVLLPRAAAGWPSARLEAVLRHEAAHIVRRDTLSQFIARLVCAVLWFNPLLWLGLRVLRRDAEIAADDAVLASGMTPSLYAAELVRLAVESRGIAAGIAMAQPPLTQRIEAVLAENSSRKGVSRMDIAKTVCFGLAATLLLGVARFDIAVAQDAPAPVAPVAPVAPMAQTAPEAARIPAQVDRVKARADSLAAEAKARAEAETDPAKKEQYRRQAGEVAAEAAQVKAHAEQVAAQSAQVKSLADQVAADARQKALASGQTKAQAEQAAALSDGEAARHMTQAFKLADEVRRQSDAVKKQAEMTGRDADIGNNRSLARLAEIQPQIEQALASAHLDEQVAKALADAHLDEQIAKAVANAHLDAVTAKAITEAHITEAIASAHISERIAAAMARAQAVTDVQTKKEAVPVVVPPVAPR